MPLHVSAHGSPSSLVTLSRSTLSDQKPPGASACLLLAATRPPSSSHPVSQPTRCSQPVSIFLLREHLSCATGLLFEKWMIEVPCLVSFNEHPGCLTQIIYKGLSYIKGGWGERSIFLRTWLSGSVCQLLQSVFLAMDDRSRRFRIDSLLDMASFVSFLCPWVEWAFQISQLFGRGQTSTYLFFFPLCTFQRKCLQPGYFCFPSSETFKVPRRTSSYGNRFDSHLARVEPTFYWTARWSPVKWRDKHEESASSSSCEEMGLESWNWARLFHLGQVLRNPAFARSQRPEDNKSSAKNG